jgi:hypothetical protein
MREIRPSGSVRGVRRKPYPYRDTHQPDAKQRALLLGAEKRSVDGPRDLPQSRILVTTNLADG